MASEYHYLLGAEDVKHGGYAVQEGAAAMLRAVSELNDLLFRTSRAAEDFIQRLERVLEDDRIARLRGSEVE